MCGKKAEQAVAIHATACSAFKVSSTFVTILPTVLISFLYNNLYLNIVRLAILLFVLHGSCSGYFFKGF